MAPRLTTAALLLALSTACGTSARVVRLDTGRGAPLKYRPSTASRPVMVDAAAFEDALSRLVLDVPLSLRSPEQGWLVRASYPGDARAPGLTGKDFGGRCKAGPRRTCPSLLDFVGMSERDRLVVALGYSLEPMEASISRAVEKILAPELFYGLIATGIVSWIVLAANPEPVFTKAAAIVSALALIYLGVEMFLEVLEASRELKRASDNAATLEDLQQAGERFANRVGPQVARVFVLAVTVAVTHGMGGGAGWLASRVSMLPRFTEAALAGGSWAGITLANVGEVTAVTVAGSTVVISLPASAIAAVAIAMEAQGDGDTSAEESGQLHHTPFPSGSPKNSRKAPCLKAAILREILGSSREPPTSPPTTVTSNGTAT